LGAIRSSCRSSGTFSGLRAAVCVGQIALKRDSVHFLVFGCFGATFHPDLLGVNSQLSCPDLTRKDRSGKFSSKPDESVQTSWHG